MTDPAVDVARVRNAVHAPSRASFGAQARIVRAVLLALAIVVVFFAAYEVVERLWLKDVDAGSLNILHLARGLIASAVSALVAGWLIVRVGAPLRATTPSADAWTQGVRPAEEERITGYLLWFVLLRWVAVIVATALTVVVWMAGMLATEAVLFLAATIVVLVALNVAYAGLMGRHPRLDRHLLSFQAYADLLILSVMLHFSGGIENPFSVAMIFHVILAGIVLGRRQCYGVAAAATLFFTVLAWGEGVGAFKHYTLDVFPHLREHLEALHAARSTDYIVGQTVRHAVILFVVAYLVTTLTERIRYSEQQLSLLADREFADRQLLERSLENTGTGFCVVDNALRATRFNGRWRAWFPDAPDAADGDAASRAAYGPVRRTLEDGAVRVIEVSAGVRGQRGEAEAPTFQITTAALHDGAGRVTHAVALAQDISEQKRARSRILRAERLAAVGEMAGYVAHEVNNPIAILSAKARLLLADRRAEMSDKVGQELTKITGLADRVAQIAQTLLSYSRPAGTRAPLDLRGPVRQALALVEQAAHRRGVRIEDRLPAVLPAVCADAGELEQVFLNLFLNALNAMPHGGRLHVHAREPDAPVAADRVTVVVEDDGTGIAPEVRDRVFEPFFSTRPGGEGTGLGLPVCMGIVASHGGDIQIDSEPGRGARVSVTLPTAGAGGGRA